MDSVVAKKNKMSNHWIRIFKKFVIDLLIISVLTFNMNVNIDVNLHLEVLMTQNNIVNTVVQAPIQIGVTFF